MHTHASPVASSFSLCPFPKQSVGRTVCVFSGRRLVCLVQLWMAWHFYRLLSCFLVRLSGYPETLKAPAGTHTDTLSSFERPSQKQGQIHFGAADAPLNQINLEVIYLQKASFSRQNEQPATAWQPHVTAVCVLLFYMFQFTTHTEISTDGNDRILLIPICHHWFCLSVWFFSDSWFIFHVGKKKSLRSF